MLGWNGARLGFRLAKNIDRHINADLYTFVQDHGLYIVNVTCDN